MVAEDSRITMLPRSFAADLDSLAEGVAVGQGSGA